MSRANLFIFFLVTIAHGLIIFSFSQDFFENRQEIYQPSLQGLLITPLNQVDKNDIPPLIKKTPPIFETQPIRETPPVVKTQPISEIQPIVKTQPTSEMQPIVKTQPTSEMQPIVKTQPTREMQPIVKTQPTRDIPPIVETLATGETQAIIKIDKEPSSLVLPHLNDANALNNPKPIYPRLSRRLHEEGTVLLEILILSDGSVGEIRLKTSSGFTRLDQTAKATVKHWRYQPAKQNGKPIAYLYIQPVYFSLTHSKT
ncbi:MAG: protein TonB [Alteromonadaceae bacterium]